MNGNNKMGAQRIFSERENYERYVDEKIENDDSKSYIDLRKKNLYGKVNLDNELVCPLLENMVSHAGIVNTFDFVSDGLTQLKDRLAARSVRGTFRTNGSYAKFDITPRNNSWRESYVSHLKRLQQAYYKNFLSTREARDSVTTFKEFIPSFLDFVVAASPANPVTFSKYWTSHHSDHFQTGLAFDLNGEMYGNDSVSVDKYFDDTNYNIFVTEVQNHGFIMDRHAPHRFIVNFSAQKTKENMEERGYLNMKDFFDKNYFTPIMAEFVEVVKFLSVVYVEEFGQDDKYVDICYKAGKTTYSVKNRDIYTPDSVKDMLDYIGVPTWMRIFSFIKAREANADVSQHEFDEIVKTATEMQKSLDTVAALVYINDKFNPLFESKLDRKPKFKF